MQNTLVNLASQSFGHGSLEAILRCAMEAVGASGGAVFLLNPEDDSLSMGPSLGLASNLTAGMTTAQWVVAHEEPLALENTEQAYKVPGLTLEIEPLLPLICVPIFGEGKILGALQGNGLSIVGGEDVRHKLLTLQLAADYMACLLDKTRLEHELQGKEAFVIGVVRASIDAQEAERERICLEVHDGVAQTLASAFQYLQALEKTLPSPETQVRHMVSRTVALVRQAIQEAREVINSLTPATLRDLGLVRTLQQELKQFERETGCKVDLDADWPRLAPDVEIALYRVIHEALTNVRKHAHSPRVHVELSRSSDRLLAQVKDWGVGFDPARPEQVPTRTSAGLFSMRKRAELLGGACEIHSAPGQGTEVSIEVPFAS